MEAVEEKKPEPVVEKSVQSPILTKESVKEQTKSDVSFSPMSQTFQQPKESIFQQPEVHPISDQREFGVGKLNYFQEKF